MVKPELSGEIRSFGEFDRLSMKLIARLITIVLLLAGGVFLLRISVDNRELARQIEQLEAELGRMPIIDSDRVHIVEIETPDVPPEVARHLKAVWQFRCYLPPGYDVMRFSGGGRVAEEGIYLDGGRSSGWGMPPKEAVHRLLTISFRKQGDRVEAFNTFGGSSGTASWNDFEPDRFDSTLVVQKLVHTEQGPRSFDQQTILPLLKIYDPSSAEDKQIAGETTTTYAGGLFGLCPKTHERELRQLNRGETPIGFDASSIATVASDE